MGERFFVEDVVACKEAPAILAVVEQTWRNVDSGSVPRINDWIAHSGISETLRKKWIRDGEVPVDHVVIRFLEPYTGCTLVNESELILKDRGLVVGDQVKRNPSDSESGTVIDMAVFCTLRPVYTKLPYHGSEPWPYLEEENEITVPSEEVEYLDYQVGDHIIYQGWVGEIIDLSEQVMIRLANGSVVAVQDSVELGVFDNFPRKPDSKLSRQSLAINLRLSQESLAAGSRTLDETTMPCEFFYPGQVVSTKKANLRLGSWIIGSYDASHKANGIVVGVRVISINIEWVTSNVFDMSRTSASPPPNQLQSTALDEVRLYNKNCLPRNAANPSSVFGSRQGHDMVVGDYVKFRDITGATLKYSEQSHLTAQNGVFRRIPRIITQGFDMNVFRIRETTSKARIQWQDGSITEHDATKLIPDINFDEHEVWPGEICSLKSTETLEEGVRVLGTVGVVQTCNARERLASIRWFRSPNAAVFEDQDSVLVPGSLLGELTDHETMVSFYDISSYPALTKMRGDLVLISPNPTLLAMHNALVLKEASTRTTDVPSMGDFSDRYNDPTVFTDDPQNIGAADGGVSWFGEIVDLGTDGLLTVRLGALDKVRDIKVSVERVITAIGGDHEGFGSDSDSEPTSDEDESDWSDSDSDDLKVIEEVVEYEGGQRLDNGGEDVWMTDDSGDEDDSDEDSKPQLPQSDARHAMEEIEDTCAEDIQSPAVPNNPTSTLPRRSVEHHEEYQFANLQNMPVQFEVLDEEVAVDHRYLHKSPRLSAKLLRRIRKEHSILENSLPTGIWVRTWADRLDLMRILIVGPRGTPYELAPFMLDLHFKDDFPESPPIVFFHSWTHGVGRINPNLYEDGNVCLSILGTWPGDSKGEGWTPEKSSVLQIIVSLLGLVLVAEPYFNEAGYETLVGLEESLRPSQIYTEKALCMAKGFVSYALNHTLNGIDHIKNWVYVDPSGPQLLQKVVEESTALLDRKKDNDVLSTGMEDPNRDRLSAGAEVLLKRYLGTLQQMLQDGLATQQNSKPSDSLGPQQQGQANPNPQMQQEDAMDWSPNP